MAGLKNLTWKVLVMGRGQKIGDAIEKHVHGLGYKNIKAFAIENNKTSDEQIIKLLKEHDWHGIAIGGGITGYYDGFPREVQTLHWFNRLANIVHKNAPKAKFLFLTGPDDLINSIERVLDSQKKTS